MLIETLQDKTFASNIATIAKAIREKRNLAAEQREFDLTMQIMLKGKTKDVKVARETAKQWIAEYDALSKK